MSSVMLSCDDVISYVICDDVISYVTSNVVMWLHLFLMSGMQYLCRGNTQYFVSKDTEKQLTNERKSQQVSMVTSILTS